MLNKICQSIRDTSRITRILRNYPKNRRDAEYAVEILHPLRLCGGFPDRF